MQGLQQTERFNESLAKAPDEMFLKEYLSFIKSIAASIFKKGSIPVGIEFDDLVNWGVEGLLKAEQNYKEGKGKTFKSYAYYRIHGEITDYLRKEWRYRNPAGHQQYKEMIQDRIVDMVESVLDMESSENVSPKVLMQSLIRDTGMMYLVSLDDVSLLGGKDDQNIQDIDNHSPELQDAIESLDDDEKELIHLFYIEGYKQKEIAEKMYLSASKVCRMHASCLQKLRKRLEKSKSV